MQFPNKEGIKLLSGLVIGISNLVRRRFTREKIEAVRGGPGVYKLYTKNAKKPTYIGSSEYIRNRLMEHKRQSRYHTFEVHHTDTTEQAKEKEQRMIKRNKPKRNIA